MHPKRLMAPFDPKLQIVSPGPSFHAAHPFVALDHMVLGGKVRVAGAQVHATPLSSDVLSHVSMQSGEGRFRWLHARPGRGGGNVPPIVTTDPMRQPT